jgi:Mce-associated membrane protein
MSSSRSLIMVLSAAAFALAAFVAAVIFGAMWLVASSNNNADLARSRDEVVKAGGTAIKAYTEVDFENLDAFFNRQKAVSDDQMAQQLAQLEPTYRKALGDAKTKVATTIQDIAVEELDDHEGKASFLAAITTQVTQGDKSSSKALRLEVSMTRVGEEWKLSGIDNVPLVAAGQ